MLALAADRGMKYFQILLEFNWFAWEARFLTLIKDSLLVQLNPKKKYLNSIVPVMKMRLNIKEV